MSRHDTAIARLEREIKAHKEVAIKIEKTSKGLALLSSVNYSRWYISIARSTNFSCEYLHKTQFLLNSHSRSLSQNSNKPLTNICLLLSVNVIFLNCFFFKISIKFDTLRGKSLTLLIESMSWR